MVMINISQNWKYNIVEYINGGACMGCPQMRFKLGVCAYNIQKNSKCVQKLNRNLCEIIETNEVKNYQRKKSKKFKKNACKMKNNDI
jgi:hypothetical protein